MEHNMLISLNELLSPDALTNLFITLWAQLMGAPIYAKALSRVTKKAIKKEIDAMLAVAKDGKDSYDVDISESTENVWQSITFDEQQLLGNEYNVQDQLFEAFKTVRNIIWCYHATSSINTDNVW